MIVKVESWKELVVTCERVTHKMGSRVWLSLIFKIVEKALQEQNNQLGKKLKEKEKALAQQPQWEQPNQGQNLPSFLLSQSLPSLNIGGACQGRTSAEEEAVRQQSRPTTLMPPWMLRHVNE